VQVKADVFEHGINELSIGSTECIVGVISNLNNAWMHGIGVKHCLR